MSSRQLDEERIFHVARRIDDAEARLEYLQQICAGDQGLRERVEALLDVYEREQGFLASDAPSLPPTEDHTPLTERPGTTIGRYKLMEQIGEGGMGVVFVAEQQKPLQRKVALKVIKPGMDSKDVIARFEAERQALALMDHPHIARVFDAGTTESGRPFFVMELVKGVPITEYCDTNKLTIRERLELFILVCQAIQHAHQKGVIHRDVKPTNVLVTLHDGQPVPKIIDFGVAKAIHQRLTDRTLYTSFAQVIGTPLYMSPEQAELSGLDIDTRSDVYSLGVLLYELLTGTTPFDKQEFAKAAYDEIRRMIRETEPQKPSTRISSLGQKATSISQNRNTEPPRLTQLVRGDLDCIVMKALEKDRTRRFDTASNLAADIQRFLQDEPIQSRPPSTIYRATKFVRRHRLPVIIVAALSPVLLAGVLYGSPLAVSSMVVTLLIGLVGAGFGLRQAHRETKRANDATQIATAKQAELVRVLNQLHHQLIETALLLALEGRSKEFDACLQQARSAGVPRGWLRTLEGAAFLHTSDALRARRVLQEALIEDEGNVAAMAMLVVMHTWNGDWNQWSLLVEQIRRVEPRPQYRDFDLLCLAYAKFYEDHLQAAQQLDAILKRHPTWIAPRALMAAAWGHAAGIHENLEYARRALYEIEVPTRLAPDNPFVMVCAQCVYFPAEMLLGAEYTAKERRGVECAKRMAAYPENHILANLRAIYYQHTGNVDEERQAWNDILEHGSGFVVEEALATKLFWNEIDDLPALENRGLEADTALAFISAYRGRDDEAYATYERISGQYRTWYVRHKLVQILLLLHRHDEAREACRSWVQDSVGVEHFGDWEKQSIEFVAGLRPSSEFTARKGDPIGDFFVNYQHAFLAYSRGQYPDAQRYFSEATKWTYVDERRHWARAFARRLEVDTKEKR